MRRVRVAAARGCRARRRASRRGSEEKSFRTRPEADCSASSPASPSASPSAAPRPRRRPRSRSRSRPRPAPGVGGVIVASTVSSGSSSSVTPAGARELRQRGGVVHLQPETSNWMPSGMSPGQRLDVELDRALREHAALDDAGRVVGAEELERDRRLDRDLHVDAQEVDVHGLAAHGMALDVLDEHRAGAPRRRRRPRGWRPNAPACCAGSGRRPRTAAARRRRRRSRRAPGRCGAGGGRSGSPPRRGR